MTPKAIREDFEQPEHVFTSEDLPHDPDTHNDNPLSGKIGEALGKKRRQCEAGAVNVIAFCNPLPMNDNSFLDTLYGTTMPIVPFKEDKNGVRHFQDLERFRNHKAPFVPFADIPVDGLTDEQKDELEEDRQQFAVPFEMMSAVWLFRRGWHRRQVCLPNPNATCPVPLELAKAMTDSDAAPSKPSCAQDTSENTSTVEESGIADPSERFLTYADLAAAGIDEADVHAEVKRHFDHEEKLSGYTNPLLILHTENDGLIDISHAERNNEWAGSAQKQFVRFPHGNHNTIFRANLTEYLDVLRKFVDSPQRYEHTLPTTSTTVGCFRHAVRRNTQHVVCSRS